MNLSQHFTKEELIYSDTAKQKGISNEPNDIELGHLRLLCTYLLEPLRHAWGSGIKVTSGFRSEALNNAIGGSKTSAHSFGYAADIQPANGNMKEFKAFVKDTLKLWKNTFFGFAFDQCIDERNTKGAEWIHIGICNGRGEMRNQFLITTDGKTYKQDEV